MFWFSFIVVRRVGEVEQEDKNKVYLGKVKLKEVPCNRVCIVQVWQLFLLQLMMVKTYF